MFGLFEYTGAHYSLQINPASDVANVAHLDYFHFIGRVIGMVSGFVNFFGSNLSLRFPGIRNAPPYKSFFQRS